MKLGKDDLLVRAVLGSPERDTPLEGAELPGLIAPRKLVKEQGKQGVCLQGAVAFETGLHPRPISGKGVGARALAAGLAQLAR